MLLGHTRRELIMLKNKELLKLNLQHFATEPEGDPEPPAGDPEGNPPKKIELTEDEMNKKIEADSDRKLQSALSEQKEQMDKDTQSKIDEAIKEQQRLSQLSSEEAQSEKLKQWEENLKQQQDDINASNMLTEARADLRDKELPESFAEMLVADNAENTLANIKEFQTNFDEAVNETVKEKVRQATPPGGSGTPSGKGTVADDFAQARNKSKQAQSQAPDPWASQN